MHDGEDPHLNYPGANAHWLELKQTTDPTDLWQHLVTDKLEDENQILYSHPLSENNYFSEVRSLSNEYPESENEFVDQLLESPIVQNKFEQEAALVGVFLEQCALLKIYDPVKFKTEVSKSLTKPVWENFIHPYLESFNLHSFKECREYIKLCYYAKLVLPEFAGNYEVKITKNNHFVESLNDSRNTQEWEKFLENYEYFYYLGLGNLVLSYPITTSEWQSIKFWLKAGKNEKTFYAKKLELANLVRPAGEEVIKLTEDQWQACKHELEKTPEKSFKSFLRDARRVQYAQVA